MNTGDKTIDDYLALPDEVRVELIDGVFYDMAAPNSPHGMIAENIWKALDNFVDENGWACGPRLAPADVSWDLGWKMRSGF